MSGDDLLVIAALLLICISGILVNLKMQAPDRHRADAGTLRWFRLLFPTALLFATICWYFHTGSFASDAGVRFSGMMLFTAGMLIRWTAILSLGKSFTVQVAIHPGQELIRHGIYKWVRHPSYTGLVLYYTGLGLLMHNYLSLLFLLPVVVFVIYRRIAAEEKILLEYFGLEYETYMRNTGKLFPKMRRKT